MRMVNTPDNIFEDGALYLAIYVGGFTSCFCYNVATGILLLWAIPARRCIS